MHVELWCQSARVDVRDPKDPANERYNGYRMQTVAMPACPRVGEYIVPRDGFAGLEVRRVFHLTYRRAVMVEVGWVAPEEWYGP